MVVVWCLSLYHCGSNPLGWGGGLYAVPSLPIYLLYLLVYLKYVHISTYFFVKR